MSFFKNKVTDRDANHSVAVDSYNTANDLKPAYDPLSLRREATVSDKDLSQTKSIDVPVIKKAKNKHTESFESFENTVQTATQKLPSWLDFDSLEEKFEDFTGYKVSIRPSNKGQTLHEKAQEHKNAMKMVKGKANEK